MGKLTRQRWQLASPEPERLSVLETQLKTLVPESDRFRSLLARLFANRGIEEPDLFLNPNSAPLPDPREDFPDLAASVERLAAAIRQQEAIAICGDYDADGMTSTALLLRTFRHLGGQANYAIPSRMTEGYGINERIVRQLCAEGVSVVVTVDNGIAAYEPIALARELGLSVIVTDHHDIPPQIPPADTILNPKLIAAESPYRSMAGVGVAYLLALELAAEFGQTQALAQPLLELLTLGTIADLAPLTGINRRWVKAGLALLPHSQILGIQALMQVSGLTERADTLPPEAIGFGLGPRVNAVGRLAQPSAVIELLTTDDAGVALEQAMQCEQLNQQRRQLCTEIEAAAIAQIEAEGLDPLGDRVLVLLGEGWHHGTIGIVASRLLERYSVPVFIGSLEEGAVRGSARGIPGFNVFAALQSCDRLFDKFGGHPAAGGFSMSAGNWPALQQGLRDYARTSLAPDDLLPLVQIDAELALADVGGELFECLQLLQPYGMGNREPTFCIRNLTVVQQRLLGREGAHLKLQVRSSDCDLPRAAIAWRSGAAYPLPKQVDLVFNLRESHWKGEVAIELEVKGIRAAQPDLLSQAKPSKNSAGHERSPLNLNNYRSAPQLAVPLTWHTLDSLETPFPQSRGTVLLYGDRRPSLSPLPPLDIHYDRPQSGQPYTAIWLWSLPPSLTHLNWLLSATCPASPEGHQIYLHRQAVAVPSAETLQQHLDRHLRNSRELDLLRLAQQWWVSPSVLVAGLRSLGWDCPTFPATSDLPAELEKLQRWFASSAGEVAAIVEQFRAAQLALPKQ